MIRVSSLNHAAKDTTVLPYHKLATNDNVDFQNNDRNIAKWKRTKKMLTNP